LIEINNPTGISEFTPSTPSNYLLRVAPNPVRKNTTIVVSMPKAAPVHIDLVDAAGRIEDKIFAGSLPQGQHRISYEIKSRLTSGTYFIRLYNNGNSVLKKITVLN